MARKPTKSQDASPALFVTKGGGLSLAGTRIDANGQPVKSYTKDLIRDGEWVVPQTGVKFQVTPALREHWAAEFARMTANGVKVPVPNGHTTDALENQGYVTGLFNGTGEGGSRTDTLYASIDLIGTDAIEASSKIEVSIFVPPELKDGKGNVYKTPIAHVALTPVPVVSGQDGFIPIAASRDAAPVQVPVFRLAQPQGESMNDMLLSIAKALGVDVSGFKDDASVHDAILAKIGGAAKASQETVAAKDAAVAAARTATAALALAREGPKFTHLEIKSVRTARRMALDQKVASGNLTPAAATALSAVIAPDGDGIALSLSPDLDAMVDGVIAAIGLIDAKILGAQTKAQEGVSLSRATPGGEGKPLTGAEAMTAAASLMSTIGIK